jgi:MFS family permease
MKKLLDSRWYAMGLTLAATFLVIGVCRLCMPVLFKEIATDLNFDLVAVGTVWGVDPLAGVFVSLLSGLLVDRFGVKKTLAVVCILSAIFEAARGLSVDFLTMTLTSFVFGLVGSTIATIGTKVTAVWFRDRYLKITNTLIFIAMYLGQMTGSLFSASVFSPLLGGWRNVMFVYAIPVLITGILWFTVTNKLAAPAPSSGSQAKTGVLQGLKHVARIRNVWIMGILLYATLGSIIAINGYLPIYLRGLGWDTMGSGGALTLMLAGAFIGTLPILFTNNRGFPAKTVVAVSTILMCFCSALFAVAEGPAILVLAVITGFLRAAPSVLITVMVLESKEVGAQYAGTAIGLVYSFGMLGAFSFPPMGNSLAAINPGLPFVFWAALCLVSLSGFFFLKKREEPSKAD